MQRRALGNTGLEVSTLGFGCGWVGGMMIKGSPADQARSVARARELGINYFDTAPHYGNGESERALGQALKAAGVRDAIVGTKTWVQVPREGNIARGIADYIRKSIETSLALLQLETVDLFQLHNVLGVTRRDDVLDPATVLNDVVPVFQQLQHEGKVRAIGFTALGETAAIEALIDSGAFATAQVVCNLLNDSAVRTLPANYPAQDYRRIVARMQARGMGALCIRAMAGGALSGTTERHPLGLANVPPLGSGASYEADVARAQRLQALVDEGHAASLVEAAVRFCTGNAAFATTVLGLSSLDQLEAAAAATESGTLTPAALSRLASLQSAFVGEPR